MFHLSVEGVCAGHRQQEAVTESLRFGKILQDDGVNLVLGHFEGWGSSHLTAPMHYHTFSEDIFPDAQPETPLAQLEAMALVVWLVAGEKRHLATISIYGIVDSSEITAEQFLSGG